MAGPYSISYDPTQDPGERLAPEIREEIAEVAPSTVTDGSIDEDKLAEDAVTTGKLADDAVTQDKIADGAVGSAQLANGGVQTVDLSDDSVTGAKAGLGTVTSLDKDGNYIETKEVYLTAADYAALSVKDPNTTYYTAA